ncbi:MAG: SMI1/KNR4 family protein [Lysobacter sp.]
MDISRLKLIEATRPPLARYGLAAALDRSLEEMPAQLLDLYSETNGFMSPMGNTVYEAVDLAERNQTFEVAEFSPGFILIGDNSGGRGYLISLDGGDLKVYGSDLGDLGPEDFSIEAESISDWISRMI